MDTGKYVAYENKKQITETPRGHLLSADHNQNLKSNKSQNQNFKAG